MEASLLGTCDSEQCYLRSCKCSENGLGLFCKEEGCRLDASADVIPLVLQRRQYTLVVLQNVVRAPKEYLQISQEHRHGYR